MGVIIVSGICAIVIITQSNKTQDMTNVKSDDIDSSTGKYLNHNSQCMVGIHNISEIVIMEQNCMQMIVLKLF